MGSIRYGSQRSDTITVLALFGLLLCSTHPSTASGRDDPIEVLWLTEYSHVRFDLRYSKREPMVDVVLVPATRQDWVAPTMLEVRRLMRWYFPKRYEDLVEDFEFIVIRDMDFLYFTYAQLEWMRRAMEEEGLGSLAEESAIYGYYDRWTSLGFWDAYPNDREAVEAAGEGYDLCKGDFTIILNEDPTLPPVFTRFGDHLDLKFWYGATVYMAPRPGSRVYAWAKTMILPQFSTTRQGTFPHILGWEYGNAYTWCVGETSSLGIWQGEYGPDAYFSMLMYSTGRGLPEDVVFVHRLKERFYEYSEKKGFIISMVEFVEKFGANTNPLMVEVVAMGDRWEEARGLYIGQDYEGSWSLFDQLLMDIDTFTEDALSLKDRTLFWVYVTEWCTITAAFLLSGFLLWTLMVKRRLYKMVDQTRLRPPPGEAGAGQGGHSRGGSYLPWWRKHEHRERVGLWN